MWQAASMAERAPYLAQFRADKARYHAELDIYMRE